MSRLSEAPELRGRTKTFVEVQPWSLLEFPSVWVGLSEHVVVGHGPFGIRRRVPHVRLAERGVTDAHHAEFGWHAVEVCADAIKVDVGCAIRERACYRKLRGRILRNWLLLRVHKNGIYVRQVAKGCEKCRKLGGCAVTDSSGNQLVFHARRGCRLENLGNERPRTR